MSQEVMYLFRKLRMNVHGKPGEKQDVWYMVLRSVEEVLGYLNVDAGLFAEALFTLNKNATKTHLAAPRERVLHISLLTAAITADGQPVFPHEVLQKLLSGKAKSMLSLLMRGEFINVNNCGGYCGHKSFCETWEAEVIDEIEKPTTYLPQDAVDDLTKGEVLFLENAERTDIDLIRAIDNNWHRQDQKFYHKIEMLKEQDPKFILESIKGHKTIAMKSNLMDSNQITNMMRLFASDDVEPKEVIIMTEFQNELTTHELWAFNNSKHNIKFI